MKPIGILLAGTGEGQKPLQFNKKEFFELLLEVQKTKNCIYADDNADKKVIIEEVGSIFDFVDENELKGYYENPEKQNYDEQKIEIPKQCLKIGSKYLFQWPLEAMLRSNSLENVIAIGPQKFIDIVASEYIAFLGSKLFLVPEGKHMMDNVNRASLAGLMQKTGTLNKKIFNKEDCLFLDKIRKEPTYPHGLFGEGKINQELKEMEFLITTHDAVLLEDYAIDYVLKEMPTGDFVMYTTDYAHADEVESQFEMELYDNEHKASGFRVENYNMRPNNIFLARLFKAGPSQYKLFQTIFDNRHVRKLKEATKETRKEIRKQRKEVRKQRKRGIVQVAEEKLEGIWTNLFKYYWTQGASDNLLNKLLVPYYMLSKKYGVPDKSFLHFLQLGLLFREYRKAIKEEKRDYYIAEENIKKLYYFGEDGEIFNKGEEEFKLINPDKKTNTNTSGKNYEKTIERKNQENNLLEQMAVTPYFTVEPTGTLMCKCYIPLLEEIAEHYAKGLICKLGVSQEKFMLAPVLDIDVGRTYMDLFRGFSEIKEYFKKNYEEYILSR